MKQSEIERVQQILFELSEILFKEDTTSLLGKRFRALSRNETMLIYDYKQQIKGLFGGMGSMNDIVIFDSDGNLNRHASARFHELKEELYAIVK